MEGLFKAIAHKIRIETVVVRFDRRRQKKALRSLWEKDSRLFTG